MLARVDGQALKVVGLLMVAVVVGVVVGRPQPGRDSRVSVDPPPIAMQNSVDVVVVHLSGEVVSPGLVEVAADARVADVIAAAGGVTVRADLPSVNLAEPVVDGQQIVVPAIGRDTTEPIDSAAPDARIRINDADAVSLESLPGVGPVLAEAILAHRAEYGPFRSVEDLLDVAGIGERKLASLRDRIIVP